jgi:hypothetical protein
LISFPIYILDLYEHNSSDEDSLHQFATMKKTLDHIPNKNTTKDEYFPLILVPLNNIWQDRQQVTHEFDLPARTFLVSCINLSANHVAVNPYS